MEAILKMLEEVFNHIKRLAESNAVVAKPISVGDRHAIPLCEISMAFGGAGGSGNGPQESKRTSRGTGVGGGGGGGAKVTPVAIFVVDGDTYRLEQTKR